MLLLKQVNISLFTETWSIESLTLFVYLLMFSCLVIADIATNNQKMSRTVFKKLFFFFPYSSRKYFQFIFLGFIKNFLFCNYSNLQYWHT